MRNAIDNATSPTYTPASADVGKYLRATVTVTSMSGNADGDRKRCRVQMVTLWASTLRRNVAALTMAPQDNIPMATQSRGL